MGANCVEKSQDCEEFVKSEMKKLKTSVEETDNFVRNEAQQIQENTEKNMKEVTRTLANLVEQQQTKANSQNVDSYDRLNKRLDKEIKNFGDMIKDMPKDDNKQMDETKFNARMERLGKVISLMKAKQTDLSQTFDNSLSKQTFLETQNKNIASCMKGLLKNAIRKLKGPNWMTLKMEWKRNGARSTTFKIRYLT